MDLYTEALMRSAASGLAFVVAYRLGALITRVRNRRSARQTDVGSRRP